MGQRVFIQPMKTREERNSSQVIKFRKKKTKREIEQKKRKEREREKNKFVKFVCYQIKQRKNIECLVDLLPIRFLLGNKFHNLFCGGI